MPKIFCLLDFKQDYLDLTLIGFPMNGRHFLATLALLSILATPVFSTSTRPKHIHLGWLNDTRTTVTISWRTEYESPGIVEYGLDSSYGQSVSGPNGRIHHVELSNLEPETTYHFRCGCDGAWSRDLSFTTAPSSPETPFKFVALGDSRTNMYVWNDICEAVSKSNAPFCIHTGDLVSEGDRQEQWNQWFESGQSLLSGTVFMPTIGGHEKNSHKYFEQFALPEPQQWYSFDYGNVHFVALSTENWMEGPQKEWLEKDLSSTDALWKIVFYHIPMYSSGSHGPSPRVQQAWRDIFDRYHVDLVFNGHDHLYSRSLPIYNGKMTNFTDRGTIHMVTGGAGAPLHGVEPNDFDWLGKALTIYHYVIVEVNGSRLHLEARTIDNETFDVLDIDKKLSPDLVVEDPVMNPEIPSPNSEGVISATVINRGHLTSNETDLILLSNSTECLEISVPSLEPGESWRMEADWSGVKGKHNLTMIIDPQNEIDEGVMEWNNGASLLVDVSPPKPDLIPLSLDVESGDLMAGEISTLSTTVKNIGNSASESCICVFSAGQIQRVATVPGLLENSTTEVVFENIALDVGDWEGKIIVDGNQSVEEIREGNNLLEVPISVREFISKNGAHYPKGAVEGEPLIIRYDDRNGSLPQNSDSCAIIWGINDWNPPESRPVNTASSDQGAETVMHRGLGGYWTVYLPVTKKVNMVNFKFRNGQLTGDTIDDNQGNEWMVPTKGWALELVEELRTSLIQANEQGLHLPNYQEQLGQANESLEDEDYLRAVSIVGNATREVKTRTLNSYYETVNASYFEAVNLGASIPRGPVLLNAAQEAIEECNFRAARSCLDRVKGMVLEAKEQIPELSPSLTLFVLVIMVIGIGKKGSQEGH